MFKLVSFVAVLQILIDFSDTDLDIEKQFQHWTSI